MKKIFIAVWKLFLISILILVVGAFLFPVFYRDKLASDLQHALDARIAGQIDFKKIDLSLLKDFPTIQLEIKGLRLTGNKIDSTHHDLFYADEISFGINPVDYFKDKENLVIEKLKINNPELHIYKRHTGRSNYEILLQSDIDTTQKNYRPLVLDLKGYEIKKADIHYYGVYQTPQISLNDVDHSGHFYYRDGAGYLKAVTTSDHFFIKNGQTNLLKDARFKWDMDMLVDQGSGIYRFRNDQIHINDLDFLVRGAIQKLGSRFHLDLDVTSTDHTFKDLLSVLPNMYVERFKEVQASGYYNIGGEVKGIYSIRQQKFPSYLFDIQVRDGAFKYPNKKASFKGVNVEASIIGANNRSEVDEVDLSKFNFLLNNRSVKGRLHVKHLVSKPMIDGQLVGALDLGDLYEAYPVTALKSMSGLLHFDSSINGHVDQVKGIKYKGTVHGEGVKVKFKNQVALTLHQIQARLINESIAIDSIEGSIGRTDFKGNGSIQKLESVLFGGDPLEVKTDLKGDLLSVNEWLTTDSVRIASLQPERDWRRHMVMDLKLDYGQVLYSDYQIEDMQLALSGDLSSLKIVSGAARVQHSPMTISGVLDSLYSYNYLAGKMYGDVMIQSEYLHLSDWMEEASADSLEMNSYVTVPDRVDMDIRFAADTLQYADVQVHPISGRATVADRSVILNQVNGRTLGGSFKMDGIYHHTGVGHPRFDLKYDLSKFSFEKTFNSIKTVNALAPVGKYLDGIFNSNLILEGLLADNYRPVFSSLTGSGYLETIHGVFKKLGPFEKIADKLNLSVIRQLRIDKTKNWFEIKDGFVILEPLHLTNQDIRVLIKGRHQIFGEMDYRMRLHVPRSKFDDGRIPIALQKQWADWMDRLEKLGIQAPKIDTLILDVHMTGKPDNPDMSIEIVNLRSKTIKDALKEVVDDKKKELRDTIETKLKEIDDEIRDTIATKVNELKDTISDRVDQIKDTIQTVIDSTVSKVKDSIQSKIKDEISGRVDSTIVDSVGGLIDDLFDDWPIDIFGKQKDKKKEIEDRLKDRSPFGSKKKN